MGRAADVDFIILSLTVFARLKDHVALRYE